MDFQFPPALDTVPLFHQGKTRDTFPTASAGTLLIVATERLSTHNVIHQSAVPYKAQVLTALTIFWLKRVLEQQGIAHHLVAYGPAIYEHLQGDRSQYPDDLHLRAIVVKKLKMIPIEFIFRAYLAGSLYRSFYSKGKEDPYGLRLLPGLELMHEFPDPAFTPTQKSADDEPMDAADVWFIQAKAVNLARNTFLSVRRHMRDRGLELVDSKFEIGLNEKEDVVLADEVATPDSSRFCRRSDIKLGQEPPWLDKQVARDEAERIWAGGEKAPLTFNPGVVQRLSDTYFEVFAGITGMHLKEFQGRFMGD